MNLKMLWHGLWVLSAWANVALAQTQALGFDPKAVPRGGTAAVAFGAERYYWTNKPIPITLQVNVERTVSFPEPVEFGIPETVRGSVQVEGIDRTTLFKATSPFESTRIHVREIISQKMYALDLRAVSQGGDVRPVEIIDATGSTPAAPPVASAPATATMKTANSPYRMPNAAEPSRPTQPSANAVRKRLTQKNLPFRPKGYRKEQLVRFAFQMAYAPEHLLPKLDLPGVTPLRIERIALPNLYQGAHLKASVYAAWTDGVRYITAIQLENQMSQRVVIDPRRLRGRYEARGVLDAVLEAKGDPHNRDQALVVLVSPIPFKKALQKGKFSMTRRAGG